jgi:hypothetical protein
VVQRYARRRRASLLASRFATGDLLPKEMAELRRLLSDDAPQAAASRVLRLADVERVELRWLWPGRIPLGKVTLLDGDPGLGKSLVTLDLAARVSRGLPMPDGHAGHSGAVILLSAEDDPGDTLRPRLEAADADLDRIHFLESVMHEGEERQLVIPDDLEHLERAIREHGASLVVIDVLMAFLGGGVDSHRDQDVRRALMPLAKLAARTGAAILVIRHLNKAPGTKAVYRGGGSIGIAGAARSVLLLSEDPDDADRRVLAVVKANLAAPAPSLSLRVTEREDVGLCLEWLGHSKYGADALLASPEPEERNALDEACTWLEAELASGPRPAKDMTREAQRAGHQPRTLARARRKLGVKTTRVGFGRGGSWEWSLPKDASPNTSRLGTQCDDWHSMEDFADLQPPARAEITKECQRSGFPEVATYGGEGDE